MAISFDNTKYIDEGYLNERKELYKKLLLSSGAEGIENLILFLENKTDFFTAPASTQYHSDFEGGLLLHSLNVMTCLQRMNQTFKLGLPQSTITLSALLHDICKCNVYSKKEKFFKPDGRTWVSYTGYEFEDNLPLGHGEKSVIMAEKFIHLKSEVALMIRWHMGIYDAKDERALHNAMSLSKGVTALHLADMQASNFLEFTVDLKKLPETPEFARFRTGQEDKVKTLQEF